MKSSGESSTQKRKEKMIRERPEKKEKRKKNRRPRFPPTEMLMLICYIIMTRCYALLMLLPRMIKRLLFYSRCILVHRAGPTHAREQKYAPIDRQPRRTVKKEIQFANHG
jgi:hypothetical protein